MDENQKQMEWLLNLQNLFSTKNAQEIGNDLYNKLDLLIYLHEVLSDKEIKLKDNENFLESLVVKFYLHGITICQISKGYKIKSSYLSNDEIQKHTFIDISSLLTVGRAQMESLLMYQHLYVNTTDEDEQKFRYYVWIYTALIQRLNLPRLNKVNEEKIEQTKREIEDFKQKIINCVAYQSLTEKQQKGVFLKGTAKSFRTWDQIFIDCNFTNKGIVEKFYYVLSSYAHSEGLSGLQLKHNKYFASGEGNKNWVWLQLLTSWLLTATMIENLVSRFPPIQKAYEDIDERIKFEVNFLCKFLKNNEPIA